MKALRRPLRALGSVAGAGALRLVRSWTRVRVLGRDAVDRMRAEHGAVVYAVWHGRFLLPASLFGHEGSAVLVSRSEDGEVIARAAARLGYRPVRGSSSRGGREGLAALAAAVEAGHNAAVTPDGPRGPRHEARMGAVALAARTGRPLVPVGAAARPCWTFDSWDAFQVPRPFARGVVVFGEPFTVAPAEDLEADRRRLEERLNEVEARADREVAR